MPSILFSSSSIGLLFLLSCLFLKNLLILLWYFINDSENEKEVNQAVALKCGSDDVFNIFIRGETRCDVMARN